MSTELEMQSRYNINAAILGPVSAGKSTFMNSLFVSQYSDMKIKRTTMTPQIYEEQPYSESEPVPEDLQEYIKSVNRELNTELVKKTESGEEVTYNDIAKESVYKVPRVYNLHDLPDNVTLRVYDIPGLNDGKTAELYFQYLDNTFHQFDIIIFVIDINSACNTDGEVRILEKIVQYTRRNRENYGINNQLIVLANKCDDLHINDNGNVQIEDEELTEMYEQIKKEVATQVEKHNPELVYKICPISAEDSYIYRMYSRNPSCQLDIKHVNKFGMNEYGKSRWNRLSETERHKKIQALMSDMNIAQTLQQTGFNRFSSIFKSCLNLEQQYTYICGHFLYDMRQYINICSEKISNGSIIELKPCLDIYTNLVTVCNMYNNNNVLPKYYTFLNDLITIHMPQLILKEEDINGLISETDLEHYEWAQKHCYKWQYEFGEEYTTIHNLYKQITDLLNKYYEANINDQQKPVATLLQRFNKLCANGFAITRKLLGSLFTNKDMLNKPANEIVKILQDMRTRQLLTTDQEIKLCKDLLHRVYDNIYKGQQMGYINDDYIASYVYFADLFWHNSQLFKSEQEHEHVDGHITYLAFRARQNMVEKINSNNRKLVKVNLDLEKHFAGLLC